LFQRFKTQYVKIHTALTYLHTCHRQLGTAVPSGACLNNHALQTISFQSLQEAPSSISETRLVLTRYQLLDMLTGFQSVGDDITERRLDTIMQLTADAEAVAVWATSSHHSE